MPPHDTQPRPLRIALAHDWLVGLRGGELVLDAIARLLLEDGHTITRIYTMFDDGRPLTPALDAIARRVAPGGRSQTALRARRWLLPLYPALVRAMSGALLRDHAREPIDMLISTSSAAIKSIKPPPGVGHLCYCHAPARYLWSMQGEYGQGSVLRRAGLGVCAPALRRWDRRTAGRVTHFLGNSRHTCRQVERCYRRQSAVVFPPVRTDLFTPGETPRDDHWLVVSALEPYKRVDLAIQAAALAGKRLIVAGGGSQMNTLRALAQRVTSAHNRPDNLIEFIGRVGIERLGELYRSSELLLFPQVEDFGIVAVEAQACGCPVVARAQGGALDTVIDGHTGVLFDEPDQAAIVAACERTPHDSGACRDNALRFNENVFANKIRSAIASIICADDNRSSDHAHATR